VQELEARVTELTSQWMNLIGGGECHKDRDCHFTIERRWSYGAPPIWSVEHYGYWITTPISEKCATYKDALRFLISTLEAEYADAKKCIEERDAEDAKPSR
jgi:hypothetical protein